MYLLPFVVGTDIGPHKSECMRLKFLVAPEVKLWKDYLWCLPNIQALHGVNFLGTVGSPLIPCCLIILIHS